MKREKKVGLKEEKWETERTEVDDVALKLWSFSSTANVAMS